MHKKDEKKNLLIAFKIIIIISFIFVVTSSIIYFIEMGNEQMSYFSKHIAIFVILFLVGIIAIMLSMLSKLNLSGENKGDNMMIGVGLALIILSFVTLIMTYL